MTPNEFSPEWQKANAYSDFGERSELEVAYRDGTWISRHSARLLQHAALVLLAADPTTVVKNRYGADPQETLEYLRRGR